MLYLDLEGLKQSQSDGSRRKKKRKREIHEENAKIHEEKNKTEIIPIFLFYSTDSRSHNISMTIFIIIVNHKTTKQSNTNLQNKSNYTRKYLELGRVYTSAVLAKAFYDSVSCALLKIRNE